jgi:hypothetical protein
VNGAPRILNPLEDAEWDLRMAQYSESTVLHSAAWARVLHDAYGYQPCYLAAGEQARPTVLPIMDVRSWLTGRRGVSLPFSDFCEPLGGESGALQAALAAALDFGKAQGWRWLELRSGRRILPETPAALTYYEHILDLSEGETAVFSRLEGPVRTAIRKAVRLGVEVRVSDTLDAVLDFYALNCRSRRDHGLPPQPLVFFKAIHHHLIAPGMGFVSLARWKDRPVAANVFLYFGRKALFKFGASDKRFQEARAATVAMWEGIRHCMRSGCETLSMGRTSLDHLGLRRYKRSWGTAERRADYFRYDYRKQAFVGDRDRASGWYNIGFRCLPLSLGRWIGARLYRHVA